MRFEGEREAGEPIAGTVAVRKATAWKRRPDHCRPGRWDPVGMNPWARAFDGQALPDESYGGVRKRPETHCPRPGRHPVRKGSCAASGFKHHSNPE